MRRYEMRDLAAAPRFANPDLGLGNPAMVSTRPALADLTVLDSGDHRLLRAGIVLAHRSMDGEGAWLLVATSWSPHLPAEHLEAMTSGEVPAGVADMVAPLLRRAALAPVGTLHRTRATYLIRGTDRTALGSVIDDHYTVRREGQVLTQYREVSIDTGSMTETQVDWLDQVLREVEGLPVERHLPLPARLGVLATGEDPGGIDLAGHGALDTDASLAEVVDHVVAQALHEVLLADLDIRSGRTRKVQPLVRALRRFAEQLPVVAPVLPDGQVDDLVAELAWAADALDGAFGADQAAVLGANRYLDLYERAGALRTPALADGIGDGPARREVGAMVAAAAAAVLLAGAEAPDAPDDSGWRAAAAATERLVTTAELAALLAPKQARRLRGRARDLHEALLGCDTEELAALRATLAGASVAEAFGIGRRYAGIAGSQDRAREEFLEDWPKDSRKLQRATADLLDRLGVASADPSAPAAPEQDADG